MKAVEANGFILTISEYGEIVRQYHDTNYDRFMKVSFDIIKQHHQENSVQKSNPKEVKNIDFHMYTY